MPVRSPISLPACAAVAVAAFLALPATANPTLPTIPNHTFTVAPATGNSTTDTSNLKAALAQAQSAGGGTVIVPAGTYSSTLLTLQSNINLQLSAGATIRNASPSNTLLTAANNAHDIALTGSGILDGRATTTSTSNLVSLRNVNNLLVSGVTIANASHEHLVIEGDNNVTIDGITIHDNFTIAQTGGYLANTDAIDYSGSHFLIQNCTINAGDDDIVAKPQSTFTSDITITKCTIGAGHGISVGGQTNAGLDGLTVSHITFNGTDNGLRLKAGKGQGGIVKNVSFSDITMTNVDHPIIINSWYQSGDRYGSAQLTSSALHTLTDPGESPITVDQSNNSALYPFYDNISYKDITATGTSENVLVLYGLDSFPSAPNQPLRNIDTISFQNVSLSGSYGADIYYTSNLDLSGLSITAANGPAFNLFANTPIPEPTSLLLLSIPFLLLAGRRHFPIRSTISKTP